MRKVLWAFGAILFFCFSARGQDLNLNTQLLDAAWEGNSAELQRLLAQGANPDARDKKGQTALMYAAAKGYAEISRILLQERVDINAKSDKGATALMAAAYKGHADIVGALLDRGADVNAKEAEGMTPLISAASGGHTEIVRALLEKGADQNAKDNDGWTPLIYAAQEGYTELARMLLEKGADVNARDKEGKTALLWAEKGDHPDIVALLKKAGARTRTAIATNTTPSTPATSTPTSTPPARPAPTISSLTAPQLQDLDIKLLDAATAGNTAEVQSLLSAGADPNAKNPYGQTALTFAAARGHADSIRALLAGGANVNAKDEDEITALMFAVSENHLDAVRVLLAGGADVNARDKFIGKDRLARGSTALIQAAIMGWTEIARVLLAAGAHVDQKDDSGDTALKWAAYRGHTDTVRLLLENGADLNSRNNSGATALDHAKDKSNADIVALLSCYSANRLNEQLYLANGGKEPFPNRCYSANSLNEQLQAAAGKGDTAEVQRLLSKGANPNWWTGGDVAHGWTALMSAAKENHIDAVRLLLENGAWATHETEGLETALSFAVYNSNADMVRMLLKHGAIASEKDRYGYTLLSIAASRGHTEIVSALLAAGADVDADDRAPHPYDFGPSRGAGRTALMFAGNADTAKLLLEHGANVNARNNNGESVLMQAASAGKADVVRVLLLNGAQADEAMKAYHDAKQNNRSELVAVLETTEPSASLIKIEQEASVEAMRLEAERKLQLANLLAALRKCVSGQPQVSKPCFPKEDPLPTVISRAEVIQGCDRGDGIECLAAAYSAELRYNKSYIPAHTATVDHPATPGSPATPLERSWDTYLARTCGFDSGCRVAKEAEIRERNHLSPGTPGRPAYSTTETIAPTSNYALLQDANSYYKKACALGVRAACGGK